MQIQPERIDKLFNVVYCLLGVPACIDVEKERPESIPLLREISQVGAVDTSAYSNYTIVRPAAASLFNSIDDPRELRLARRVRMPIGQNIVVEVVTVLAPATRIKSDETVTSVHDAIGAYLI